MSPLVNQKYPDHERCTFPIWLITDFATFSISQYIFTRKKSLISITHLYTQLLQPKRQYSNLNQPLKYFQRPSNIIAPGHAFPARSDIIAFSTPKCTYSPKARARRDGRACANRISGRALMRAVIATHPR